MNEFEKYLYAKAVNITEKLGFIPGTSGFNSSVSNYLPSMCLDDVDLRRIHGFNYSQAQFNDTVDCWGDGYDRNSHSYEYESTGLGLVTFGEPVDMDHILDEETFGQTEPRVYPGRKWNVRYRKIGNDYDYEEIVTTTYEYLDTDKEDWLIWNVKSASSNKTKVYLSDLLRQFQEGIPSYQLASLEDEHIESLGTQFGLVKRTTVHKGKTYVDYNYQGSMSYAPSVLTRSRMAPPHFQDDQISIVPAGASFMHTHGKTVWFDKPDLHNVAGKRNTRGARTVLTITDVARMLREHVQRECRIEDLPPLTDHPYVMGRFISRRGDQPMSIWPITDRVGIAVAVPSTQTRNRSIRDFYFSRASKTGRVSLQRSVNLSPLHLILISGVGEEGAGRDVIRGKWLLKGCPIPLVNLPRRITPKLLHQVVDAVFSEEKKLFVFEASI